MNSYWFVYNTKSKRFLWIAYNNGRRSEMIMPMLVRPNKEKRHIVYLIDNGYKLKFFDDGKPNWETYYAE